MRSHHCSVLHHGCRDGSQVLEQPSGLTGAQRLDVMHYPLMRLRDEGLIKLDYLKFTNVPATSQNYSSRAFGSRDVGQ